MEIITIDSQGNKMATEEYILIPKKLDLMIDTSIKTKLKKLEKNMLEV